MKNNNYKKIINQIIAKNINQHKSKINENSTSKEFHKWDSMAIVKIVIDLEKHFKIKIKPNELIKLKSTASIYKLLKV